MTPVQPFYKNVTARDILFAAINGGIFGAGVSIVLGNTTRIPLPAPSITICAFALLAIIGLLCGAFLSRWIGIMFQVAKFGIVGVSNTAIDLGILNLFLLLSGPVSPLVIAGYKAISFIAAVINSFLWNKFWSFQQRDTRDAAREFFRFITVSGVGIIINVAITTGVTYILSHGTVATAAHTTIGAVVATLTVLLWNFVGYKFFVFKK